MNEHPTKIDWLVYRIFRWWWNPIFVRNPHLVMAIKTEFENWLRKNGRENEQRY